jgi:hypothetical protein
MDAQHTSVTDMLQVIQAEYREIPGLHLTKPQAQRLWGIDAATCEGVLEALVTTRFLKRTARDGYMLASLDR